MARHSMKQLLDRIERRVNGQNVSDFSRSEIIEEAEFAIAQIQRHGDQVGQAGWLHLLAEDTQTVTPVSGEPFVWSGSDARTAPKSLRLAEGTAQPITLTRVATERAHQLYYDRTRSGGAQFWWIDSYDQTANAWSIYVYPQPSDTYTIQSLYEKSGTAIADSEESDDYIFLMPEFEEVFVDCTLMRLYDLDDRDGRYEKAKKRYEQGMDALVTDALRRAGPMRIHVESELRLEGVKADERDDYNWWW